jgi:hypothetical protein
VCDDCGQESIDYYWADNNGTRTMQVYCAECEERRSDRYGCALILSEGAMCQDGACGCGGTGVSFIGDPIFGDSEEVDQ